MKCRNCGHWNRFEAEKLFVEPESPEPGVHMLLPAYKPLKTEKCSKCGCKIADEEEIIRIVPQQIMDRLQNLAILAFSMKDSISSSVGEATEYKTDSRPSNST